MCHADSLSAAAAAAVKPELFAAWCDRMFYGVEDIRRALQTLSIAQYVVAHLIEKDVVHERPTLYDMPNINDEKKTACIPLVF